MPSIVYNSFMRDVITGAVVPSADTFKMMLVTSSYSPSKSHSKRSDITNEVVGTGYIAGGETCTLTVGSVDNINNKVSISFSNTSWASATITARGCVVYKYRGGAASADELVGYVDFTSDVASTSGTFLVTISTPLSISNPS
jgi:hypothetical protein